MKFEKTKFSPFNIAVETEEEAVLLLAALSSFNYQNLADMKEPFYSNRIREIGNEIFFDCEDSMLLTLKTAVAELKVKLGC